MAVQKGIEKWKMKQWFDVYAPKAISTEIIGSIPALDEKSVTGRIMKVSLSWMTHNPNHSFAIVGLRISSANGNIANTELSYLAQQYGYLHSLVKRRADAIYTNDIVKSKDGKELRLKLLVTTRAKVTMKIKTAIRKSVSAFVSEYVSGMDKDDLVKTLISGAMQSEGYKKISQIAHVAKFEIKKIEF